MKNLTAMLVLLTLIGCSSMPTEPPYKYTVFLTDEEYEVEDAQIRNFCNKKATIHYYGSLEKCVEHIWSIRDDVITYLYEQERVARYRNRIAWSNALLAVGQSMQQQNQTDNTTRHCTGQWVGHVWTTTCN